MGTSDTVSAPFPTPQLCRMDRPTSPRGGTSTLLFPFETAQLTLFREPEKSFGIGSPPCESPERPIPDPRRLEKVCSRSVREVLGPGSIHSNRLAVLFHFRTSLLAPTLQFGICRAVNDERFYVLIGCLKSVTTSLYQYSLEHRHLFLCGKGAQLLCQ